jgi:hypothetical protein
MDGHSSAARLLVGLTIGVLLGGCATSAATSPAATPTPATLRTSSAMPTASPVPTATPTPAPKPTPTPEPVAGWPTVSRGIAMTGAVENSGENDGRLRLSVTVIGLPPGEAVSLSAAGEYGARWVCGSEPEPCGDIGCAPAFSGTTEGTAKAAAHAVAGSDGAAAARIEIGAAPPAELCPTDSTAPWKTVEERWEKVRIADPVHGLVLAPDTIWWGVTY